MKPTGSAAAAGVKCAEQVDLAAVFDGHKRCKAAELAHKRLPELLSRFLQPLLSNFFRVVPRIMLLIWNID